MNDKIEMYKHLHQNEPDFARGAIDKLSMISIFIDFLNPKSILDYGCGKGELVEALSEMYPNIKVSGYDPAVPKFSKFPEQEVDFIINTDVLEHIPEDELIETVEKISHISQHVYFSLAHRKAFGFLENGENSHCTVKPPEWYYDVFSRFFEKITPLPPPMACL